MSSNSFNNKSSEEADEDDTTADVPGGEYDDDDLDHLPFLLNADQQEPTKITQALDDESWVEAMQEELLQFKIQKVKAKAVWFGIMVRSYINGSLEWNGLQLGDSVEMAITTAASLDAAHDSDNIIKTQTTAMPNVDIPQGMDTCGSPRQVKSSDDDLDEQDASKHGRSTLYSGMVQPMDINMLTEKSTTDQEYWKDVELAV
ncbi:hypothetical protein Tco_0907329 [Tanacetum coccineum]|uniref:Uncharacterized protein n=1 Tax=Tanacetum coccineum TaxID=301880 RepID=A0ABQ5CQF7_9ASTR